MYNNKLTRTDSLAVRACQCIDSMTDLFGNNVLNRSILVWDEFKEIVAKHNEKGTDMVGFIDRFAFYEEAKKAYAVVSTTEKAFYACIILQKGCL